MLTDYRDGSFGLGHCVCCYDDHGGFLPLLMCGLRCTGQYYTYFSGAGGALGKNQTAVAMLCVAIGQHIAENFMAFIAEINKQVFEDLIKRKQPR